MDLKKITQLCGWLRVNVFFNKTLSTSNIKEKYMFSALSFCYLSSSCVMEINQNKEKLG